MSDPNAHHGQNSPLASAAHVTAHCLVGCMVGEIAGLALGIALGLGTLATIALAIALAYVTGFAMALRPVMRGEGLGLAAAMRVVWLGEAVSIGVMEVAMNGVDYAIGGIQTGSLSAPLFWIGLAAGAAAGFVVAWPVNWFMLVRELRKSH